MRKLKFKAEVTIQNKQTIIDSEDYETLARFFTVLEGNKANHATVMLLEYQGTDKQGKEVWEPVSFTD